MWCRRTARRRRRSRSPGPTTITIARPGRITDDGVENVFDARRRARTTITGGAPTIRPRPTDLLESDVCAAGDGVSDDHDHRGPTRAWTRGLLESEATCLDARRPDRDAGLRLGRRLDATSMRTFGRGCDGDRCGVGGRHGDAGDDLDHRDRRRADDHRQLRPGDFVGERRCAAGDGVSDDHRRGCGRASFDAQTRRRARMGRSR